MTVWQYGTWLIDIEFVSHRDGLIDSVTEIVEAMNPSSILEIVQENKVQLDACMGDEDRKKGEEKQG